MTHEVFKGILYTVSPQTAVSDNTVQRITVWSLCEKAELTLNQ